MRALLLLLLLAACEAPTAPVPPRILRCHKTATSDHCLFVRGMS